LEAGLDMFIGGRRFSLKMDNFYKNFFDAAPDAVIIVDHDGRITMVNQKVQDMFGYTSTELLGHHVEILIPEALRSRHQMHRGNFVQDPKGREMGVNLELPALRKDDSTFMAEISLSPFESAGELHVAAAIRDVTQKKELINQLRQKDQLVMEQNGRLVNFAHIVSHNLRSYSGNLKSLLGFYTGSKDDNERAMIIRHLQNISAGLSDVIDHLNEIVSIRLNTNVTRKKLNLLEYIDKTLKILSADIRTKDVMVNIEVAPDVEVVYDPAYLESVLLNIVSNAIKYARPEVRPALNIRSYLEQGRTCLELADNGRGIDLARFGDKLFGMYKTFHGNPDAKGIGLFITKNQVEAMGGQILVRSVVDEGTTFIVVM
jgi:PAS domain S-box-containing protein